MNKGKLPLEKCAQRIGLITTIGVRVNLLVGLKHPFLSASHSLLF